MPDNTKNLSHSQDEIEERKSDRGINQDYGLCSQDGAPTIRVIPLSGSQIDYGMADTSSPEISEKHLSEHVSSGQDSNSFITPNQTTEKKKACSSHGWTSSEKRSDEFRSPDKSNADQLSPQEAGLPRVRGAIETESGRSQYITGTIEEDNLAPNRVLSHERPHRSPLSEGGYSEEKPEFNSPFDE